MTTDKPTGIITARGVVTEDDLIRARAEWDRLGFTMLHVYQLEIDQMAGSFDRLRDEVDRFNIALSLCMPTWPRRLVAQVRAIPHVVYATGFAFLTMINVWRVL